MGHDLSKEIRFDSRNDALDWADEKIEVMEKISRDLFSNQALVFTNAEAIGLVKRYKDVRRRIENIVIPD